MHRSKYGEFWLNNIDVLREAVKIAYIYGSASIDISGILEYGKRKRNSWYGKIVVCGDRIVRNSVMVHLRSLGRIILSNNLLDEYDSCFSFTVTKDLVLLVKKLDDSISTETNTFVKTGNRSHTHKALGIDESPSFNGDLFRNKP